MSSICCSIICQAVLASYSSDLHFASQLSPSNLLTGEFGNPQNEMVLLGGRQKTETKEEG